MFLLFIKCEIVGLILFITFKWKMKPIPEQLSLIVLTSVYHSPPVWKRACDLCSKPLILSQWLSSCESSSSLRTGNWGLFLPLRLSDIEIWGRHKSASLYRVALCSTSGGWAARTAVPAWLLLHSLWFCLHICDFLVSSESEGDQRIFFFFWLCWTPTFLFLIPLICALILWFPTFFFFKVTSCSFQLH